MTRGLTIEQTSLLFYDLDFQSFEMFVDKDNGKHVMFNNNFVLDELAYLKIVKCLRTLHSIKPKVEKAANKTTKKILIDLDRQKIEKQKNEVYKSIPYSDEELNESVNDQIEDEAYYVDSITQQSDNEVWFY